MNTTYADRQTESNEAAKTDISEMYLNAIRELNLMADEFMNMVFPDKRVSELVLKIILQKELEVISCKVQHEVKGAMGRAVIFDIVAVDKEGVRYNIEVQNDDGGAIPKRARLHCAYMDFSALKKGQEAEELPETYVIFITKNDYLKMGLPLYNIEHVITQTGTLFKSGLHIIYVNSRIQDDTPLGKLMSDFWCKEPKNANYEVIKEKLEYFKYNEEGVREMSEVMQKIYNNGIVKGRAEEKRKFAQKLISEKMADDNIIARLTELPIEEVQNIRQSSNL